MHRVTFGVDGDGPLTGASARYDATADLWCDDHCDLLRVRGAEAASFLDAVRDDLTVRDELGEDGERVAVTDCLADAYAAVDPLVAAHDCVLVPPLSYVDGRRLLRVLALDGDRLQDLYRDLRSEWAVDVRAKRSGIDAAGATPGDELDGPFEALTDRQREALAIAVVEGYYERPRETTTAEIGAAMGIDRRTVEEHLRKVEQRVMTELVDESGHGRGRDQPG